MKTIAIAFLAGVVAATLWYRAQLRALDAQLFSLDGQVTSALAEVEHAHTLMDQLEGCHLRATVGIALADTPEARHD